MAAPLSRVEYCYQRQLSGFRLLEWRSHELRYHWGHLVFEGHWGELSKLVVLLGVEAMGYGPLLLPHPKACARL